MKHLQQCLGSCKLSVNVRSHSHPKAHGQPQAHSRLQEFFHSHRGEMAKASELDLNPSQNGDSGVEPVGEASTLTTSLGIVPTSDLAAIAEPTGLPSPTMTTTDCCNDPFLSTSSPRKAGMRPYLCPGEHIARLPVSLYLWCYAQR